MDCVQKNFLETSISQEAANFVLELMPLSAEIVIHFQWWWLDSYPHHWNCNTSIIQNSCKDQLRPFNFGINTTGHLKIILSFQSWPLIYFEISLHTVHWNFSVWMARLKLFLGSVCVYIGQWICESLSYWMLNQLGNSAVPILHGIEGINEAAPVITSPVKCWCVIVLFLRISVCVMELLLIA